MPANNLPTLFKDSDLSALPSTDPGSGLPWHDPTSGALLVGARGSFGLTSGEVNALIAAYAAPIVHDHDDLYFTEAEVSTLLSGYLPLSGGTLTGGLTVGGSLLASGLLQIGGTSSSHVALKRAFTTLQARLADDSDYAGFQCNLLSSGNHNPRSGATYDIGTSGLRWKNYYGTAIDVTGAINANTATFAGSLNAGAGTFTAGVTSASSRCFDLTLNGNRTYSFWGAGDTGIGIGSTTAGSRAIQFWTDNVVALTLGGSSAGRRATFAGPATFSGSIDLDGTIVPWYIGQHSLGAASNPWKDVYQSGQLLNYNATFSGTTNYERGYQRWNSNVYEIGTENAGTGVARNMRLSPSGGALIVNGNLGIGIAPTAPLHIEQSFAVVNYAIGPFVAWKNTNNSSSQGHCNFRLDTTHASASTGFVFANGGVAKFDWLIYGSPANTLVREAQNGSATALHLLAGTGLGIGKAPTCRLDVQGDAKISGVTFLGTFTVASLPPAASNAGAEAQVTDSTLAMSPANYGSTVAGGGSNRARVFCTGGNWIIA